MLVAYSGCSYPSNLRMPIHQQSTEASIDFSLFLNIHSAFSYLAHFSQYTLDKFILIVKMDDSSPYDKANFVSKVLLLWLWPYIPGFYRNLPTVGSLLPYPKYLSLETQYANLQHQWSLEMQRPKPSFVRALLKTYLCNLLVMTLPDIYYLTT